MKRFWKDVGIAPAGASAGDGWQVTLDRRAVKTQRGAPQIVPTHALAGALAGEWRAQGDEIDASRFVLRDMADYAIDVVAADPADARARILKYAESDTLCYRAEPDEPLAARQREVWEPLLTACEAAHGVRFERAAGVIHRPQPPATLATLDAHLASLDPFRLAALQTLASLAASLTIGLAALAPDANPQALYAAANLEEDWQAGLWGWDWEAEQRRARKLSEFESAARFAELLR